MSSNLLSPCKARDGSTHVSLVFLQQDEKWRQENLKRLVSLAHAVAENKKTLKQGGR